MPDFNTRKPQEPNEPNRLHIQLVANKLCTLLIATRPRMRLIANKLRSLSMASKGRFVSIAKKVRSLLVANRLRTLLIGGGILLLVVAAVPVGLLIYSSSGMGDQQQEGRIVSGMHRRPMENINVDPDLNRKIVFQLNGPYLSSYAMRTMNADGSGLKQFSDTAEDSDDSYEDPARSPDLKKIAFTRLVGEYPASESASDLLDHQPYRCLVFSS